MTVRALGCAADSSSPNSSRRTRCRLISAAPRFYLGWYWSDARDSCKVLLWDGSGNLHSRRMTTHLRIEPLENIGQFVSFVEGQTGPRWYRGVGNSKHELQPSLYRHPKLEESSKFLRLEGRIIDRFKQRSMPYLERPLKDNNWDALFLMQHYGVPTRLLDWSENPFVALYFALSSAAYDKSDEGPVHQTDAAIWVLDSVKWNKKALEGGYSDPPEALSADDGVVRTSYRLGEVADWNARSDPVAIYGSYNSARIVAQRGTFTMFGTSTAPMETTYVDRGYPQDCLLKLTIPKHTIGLLLDTLVTMGITDSAVYPDLGGLAMEIKRHNGFWV